MLLLYGIILGTLRPNCCICVVQLSVGRTKLMSSVELVLALLTLFVGLVVYTQFVIRPALRKFA